MARTGPIPARPNPPEDVWIPSVCDGCRSFCGIKAHRVDGVVVKLEGDAGNPANLGRMCAKGQAAIMAAYDPSRPTVPLKRYDWEPGDLLMLPIKSGGCTFQHFNSGSQPARLACAEPNWTGILGVDMACGFEQLEDCPEYHRSQRD